MSNRTIAVLASGCALLLTIGAWWQVMVYKNPPHTHLALWLPFIVLFRAHDPFPLFISLFQFPTLAAGFILSSRYWRPLGVLAVLVVIYTLCVWTATVMLKAGLWR